MPVKRYKAECARVATHNQLVAKLGRFWRLAGAELEAPDARSPWLELQHKVGEGGEMNIIVAMAWRDDIHKSWHVPTLVMDATMPVEIVRVVLSRRWRSRSAPRRRCRTPTCARSPTGRWRRRC